MKKRRRTKQKKGLYFFIVEPLKLLGTFTIHYILPFALITGFLLYFVK